jgi:hypothetical protein
MTTDNLPIHYDYYLSQSERWAEVFEKVNIDLGAEVVELCSGWSPKIGLALSRYGFKGTFTLTDQHRDVLEVGQELLRPVAKGFSVKLWAGSVLEDALPAANVLILNHALDDILLNEYLATVEQRELDYRSVPALKQTWKQGASWMAAHSSAYAKCLAQQCMSALSLTGQKLVLIDQYPGFKRSYFRLTMR